MKKLISLLMLLILVTSSLAVMQAHLLPESRSSTETPEQAVTIPESLNNLTEPEQNTQTITTLKRPEEINPKDDFQTTEPKVTKMRHPNAPVINETIARQAMLEAIQQALTDYTIFYDKELYLAYDSEQYKERFDILVATPERIYGLNYDTGSEQSHDLDEMITLDFWKDSELSYNDIVEELSAFFSES